MPPIFMIHGMWSRPSTFAGLIGDLAAAGISASAMTLPYHDLPPGSPAPEGLGDLRIADYVAAAERAAMMLGQEAVILGHSMGGLIAQKLAARIPHRGLILLATAPASGAGAFTLDALRTMAGVTGRWGWWREPTLLGEEAARFGVYNGVSEAETRASLAELTWDSGAVLRQIAAPFLDPARGARVDYQRISGSALVLAGAADRIVPPAVSRTTARRLAGAGARVDFEEWPGVGHWFFHDAVRPRVAGAIARFMASLSARG